MRRTVLWEAWEEGGTEYAEIDFEARTADGVFLRLLHDRPVRLEYSVEWDASWVTRAARVTVNGRSADVSSALSIGAGDVDIYAVAFTNTLLIRRLMLGVGESREIDVAYVDLDLNVTRARQRYTRTGDATYLYEGLGTGFRAELSVDVDGIVIDYPAVVRRVFPR